MDFLLTRSRYVVLAEPISGKRAVVGTRDRVWKAVKLANTYASLHPNEKVSAFEVKLEPIHTVGEPIRRSML